MSLITEIFKFLKKNSTKQMIERFNFEKITLNQRRKKSRVKLF